MSENPPVRVLLIEAGERDSIFVRNLLSRVTNLRPVMTWVRSAEEARRGIEAKDFDVILADVAICDAQALRSFARAATPRAPAPVILLGTSEGRRDESQIELPGATGYLSKVGLESNALARSIYTSLGRPRVEIGLTESVLGLQTILDALDLRAAMLDESGEIVATNFSWREFTLENDGTEDSTDVGANYLEVCKETAETSALHQGLLDVTQCRKTMFEGEYHCHGPLERRWFRLRATRLQGVERVRVLVTHHETTARKRLERRLKQGEERWQLLAEDSSDLIWSTDLDLNVTYVNPRVTELAGLSAAEMVGRSLERLLTQESLGITRQAMAAQLGRKWPSRSDAAQALPLKLEVQCREGQTRCIETQTRLVRDEWGRPSGLQLLARSVTDAGSQQGTFTDGKTHDTLTGLANREHFLKRLDEVAATARRFKHPLSFCLFNVDLRSINEEYGQLAGNLVLTSLGELLAGHLRAPDLAGRYSGDEFCAAFANTPAKDAAAALERLRRRIQGLEFEAEDGRRFTVSATFGIVDFTPQHKDTGELMEEVDKILDRARRLGTDHVVVGESPAVDTPDATEAQPV